jgi:hypothetical protein
MEVPRLVSLLILVPLAAVLVLGNIYPLRPATLFGWFVLVLLSLPVVFAGEPFGERVLGSPFAAKLPKPARAVYAVVVVGGALAALQFALPLLEGHLVKWGS